MSRARGLGSRCQTCRCVSAPGTHLLANFPRSVHLQTSGHASANARVLGSHQQDAVQHHNHSISAPTSITAQPGSAGIILSAAGSPNWGTTYFGSSETRGKNTALHPLIVL